MIDLQTIAALNGAAVMLMVIILINFRSAIRNDSPDNRLFLLMAVLTIAEAVVETASFFLTGLVFPGAYAVNVIVNDVLFINNIAFSYMWVLYVDYKLFSDSPGLKKRHILVGIPAAVLILCSLVNLFTPVFFAVDPVTMEYTRTDLFLVPILSTVFYLLYGFILTCDFKSKHTQQLFFPALIFIIPIAIALVVEYFFYGLNVLWICVAISMTSLYVNLQNQVSYIDTISGLLSRQYLTNYLRTEMKKTDADHKLTGIMLDIDNFKRINDTCGHLVGDEAISTAGSILHRALPKHAMAFRFGGDEFMIIQRVRDEGETWETVRRIRALAEKFNENRKDTFTFNFSIGVAVCRPGETLDSFLSDMDAKMYEQKRRQSLPQDV